MNMGKEIPTIKVENGVLTITITEDELKHVTEGRGDASYEVIDKAQFLKDFSEELKRYACSNATEKGITELQDFLDGVIDSTYESGSEAIIDKND